MTSSNDTISHEVEDESMWTHQVGAIVWAKVAGHSDPFWPGVVKAVKTVFQVSKNQEQYRNLYRIPFLLYETKRD